LPQAEGFPPLGPPGGGDSAGQEPAAVLPPKRPESPSPFDLHESLKARFGCGGLTASQVGAAQGWTSSPCMPPASCRKALAAAPQPPSPAAAAAEPPASPAAVEVAADPPAPKPDDEEPEAVTSPPSTPAAPGTPLPRLWPRTGIPSVCTASGGGFWKDTRLFCGCPLRLHCALPCHHEFVTHTESPVFSPITPQYQITDPSLLPCLQYLLSTRFFRKYRWL